MFAKAFTSAAAVLAATTLVSAQTFTDCNPLERTDCPEEPAFGKEGAHCDWTQGVCPVFEELPGTTITHNDKGAVFTIAREGHAPTIASHKRMFFGRLDVEVQAAPGNGIVTSIVLESANLDEIDWEWVGGDNANVQTNYFGKGDPDGYNRGEFHPVSNPLGSYHTYSIEWTSAAINWIIDGVNVRTVTYEEARGGDRYPQTPMEVKVGTWCAGTDSVAEGTREWAGGYTDFSQGPFNAYYKSISVVDYAGGDSPTEESIREYIYGDKSGSWESIKVVKGDGSTDSGKDEENDDNNDDEGSNDDDEETTSKTETKEHTKTKTEEHTKTETEESTVSTPSTTVVTTTPVSTTVTTVTTPASTTEDASETTEASETTGTEDGGAAPSQSNEPGSAARSAFSFGAVALAGVALFAQL